MNDSTCWPEHAFRKLLAHPSVDRNQNPERIVGARYNARELIDHVTKVGCTIIVRNGQTFLDAPLPMLDRYGHPIDRDKFIRGIIPALKECKNEIVHILESFDPRLKTGREDAERKRLIEEVFQRAADTPGTKVYWFYDSKKKPVQGSAAKRVKRKKVGAVVQAIPDSADFICLTGDSKWTKLPVMIIKRQKDRHTKRAKKKVFRWTGG